jgi:CSLREA domain-containing protein
MKRRDQDRPSSPFGRRPVIGHGPYAVFSAGTVTRIILATIFASMLLVDGETCIAHAAARFTVTSTADRTDASPGDGVCDVSDGSCTLRAAIMAADALGSDPNAPITINLPAGTYALTIPLLPKPESIGFDDEADKGDLNITANVALIGAGADATFIDGGGLDRVIRVSGNVGVRISGVTIRNGKTYTRSITSDEGVGLGGAGGGGISIECGSTLRLTDSVVRDNRALGGGGISACGPLTLVNTQVSGNVSLADRSNSFDGGGISSSGAVTLTNSTISDNTAARQGGGIFVSGDLTLANSTVSGNVAGTGGGGLANDGGTMTLVNVTVANNRASAGSGIRANGGQLVFMTNTIVANVIAGGRDNCSGVIRSRGYNLSSDASCGLTQPTDHPNTDPGLGPLADNGGPTATHALLAGSPAIDMGGSSADGCLSTDQRGITRPQGAACDIGAFELEDGRLDLTASVTLNDPRHAMRSDDSSSHAAVISLLLESAYCAV